MLPQKENLFRKITAVFMVTALCVSSVPQTGAFVTVSGPISHIEASAIRIPKNFGTLKEHFEGRDGRVVIYIEDAHANYGIQKNIAQILENLSEQYGLRLVGVEGVEGPLDMSLVKSFPDAEARQEIMDEAMREGETTGTEFYASTTGHPVTLTGVDHSRLYMTNTEQYIRLVSRQKENVKLLAKIRQALENLKPAYYSRENRELDRIQTAFEKDRMEFAAHIKYLYELSARIAVSWESYPMLSLIYNATEKKDQTSEAELREIFSSVRTKDLVGELEELSSKLRAQFTQNENERFLINAVRYAALLEKGTSLELTKKEATALQDYYRMFRKGVLAEHVKKLSAHARVKATDISDAAFLSEKLALQILEFYKTAAFRDKYFVEQLKSESKQLREGLSALVTGGFHSEGILKNLKKQGISYLAITPNANATDVSKNEDVYAERMLGYAGIFSSEAANPEKDSVRLMTMYAGLPIYGTDGSVDLEKTFQVWTRQQIYRSKLVQKMVTRSNQRVISDWLKRLDETTSGDLVVLRSARNKIFVESASAVNETVRLFSHAKNLSSGQFYRGLAVRGDFIPTAGFGIALNTEGPWPDESWKTFLQFLDDPILNKEPDGKAVYATDIAHFLKEGGHSPFLQAHAFVEKFDYMAAGLALAILAQLKKAGAIQSIEDLKKYRGFLLRQIEDLNQTLPKNDINLRTWDILFTVHSSKVLEFLHQSNANIERHIISYFIIAKTLAVLPEILSQVSVVLDQIIEAIKKGVISTQITSKEISKILVNVTSNGGFNESLYLAKEKSSASGQATDDTMKMFDSWPTDSWLMFFEHLLRPEFDPAHAYFPSAANTYIENQMKGSLQLQYLKQHLSGDSIAYVLSLLNQLYHLGVIPHKPELKEYFKLFVEEISKLHDAGIEEWQYLKIILESKIFKYVHEHGGDIQKHFRMYMTLAGELVGHKNGLESLLLGINLVKDDFISLALTEWDIKTIRSQVIHGPGEKAPAHEESVKVFEALKKMRVMKTVDEYDFSPDGKILFVIEEPDHATTAPKFIFTETGEEIDLSVADKRATKVVFPKNSERALIFYHLIEGGKITGNASQVYDFTERKFVRSFDYGTSKDLTISPDGRYVIIAHPFFKPQVIDLETGAELEIGSKIASVVFGKEVAGVQFSPEENFLVTSYSNGRKRVFDLRSKKELRLGRALTEVVFSETDNRILAVFKNGSFNVYRVEEKIDRLFLRKLKSKDFPAKIRQGIFSKEGNRLILLDLNGSITLFDLSEGKSAKKISLPLVAEHSGTVTAIDSFSDGRHVRIHFQSGAPWLFDLEKNEFKLKLKKNYLFTVSPNGRYALEVGSNKATAHDFFNDTKTDFEVMGLASEIQFSEDSAFLVTNDSKTTPLHNHFYDIKNGGKEISLDNLAGGKVVEARLSPKNNLLFLRRGDKTTFLLDMNALLRIPALTKALDKWGPNAWLHLSILSELVRENVIQGSEDVEAFLDDETLDLYLHEMDSKNLTKFDTKEYMAFRNKHYGTEEKEKTLLPKKVKIAAEEEKGGGVFVIERTAQAMDLATAVAIRYEYDPTIGETGAVVPTIYDVEVPTGEKVEANPEAQELMQKFDRFESLNYEVLPLLNKINKSVGDFHKLLAKMRQMLNMYEHLFKGQPPDQPLENVEDKAGGKQVAQIFIRIEKELKEALGNAAPGAKPTDALPQSVEALIQRFDGDKTASLIGTGAESYSKEQMDGVSFAELVNIVHQKGVRNLSDASSSVKGGRRTLNVKIRRLSLQTVSEQAPPTGKTFPLPGYVYDDDGLLIPEDMAKAEASFEHPQGIDADIFNLKITILKAFADKNPTLKDFAGTVARLFVKEGSAVASGSKHFILETLRKNMGEGNFKENIPGLHEDFADLVGKLLFVIKDGGSEKAKLTAAQKDNLVVLAKSQPASQLDAALFKIILKILVPKNTVQSAFSWQAVKKQYDELKNIFISIANTDSSSAEDKDKIAKKLEAMQGDLNLLKKGGSGYPDTEKYVQKLTNLRSFLIYLNLTPTLQALDRERLREIINGEFDLTHQKVIHVFLEPIGLSDQDRDDVVKLIGVMFKHGAPAVVDTGEVSPKILRGYFKLTIADDTSAWAIETLGLTIDITLSKLKTSQVGLQLYLAFLKMLIAMRPLKPDQIIFLNGIAAGKFGTEQKETIAKMFAAHGGWVPENQPLFTFIEGLFAPKSEGALDITKNLSPSVELSSPKKMKIMWDADFVLQTTRLLKGIFVSIVNMDPSNTDTGLLIKKVLPKWEARLSDKQIVVAGDESLKELIKKLNNFTKFLALLSVSTPTLHPGEVLILKGVVNGEYGPAQEMMLRDLIKGLAIAQEQKDDLLNFIQEMFKPGETQVPNSFIKTYFTADVLESYLKKAKKMGDQYKVIVQIEEKVGQFRQLDPKILLPLLQGKSIAELGQGFDSFLINHIAIAWQTFPDHGLVYVDIIDTSKAVSILSAIPPTPAPNMSPSSNHYWHDAAKDLTDGLKNLFIKIVRLDSLSDVEKNKIRKKLQSLGATILALSDLTPSEDAGAKELAENLVNLRKFLALLFDKFPSLSAESKTLLTEIIDGKFEGKHRSLVTFHAGIAGVGLTFKESNGLADFIQDMFKPVEIKSSEGATAGISPPITFEVHAAHSKSQVTAEMLKAFMKQAETLGAQHKVIVQIELEKGQFHQIDPKIVLHILTGEITQLDPGVNMFAEITTWYKLPDNGRVHIYIIDTSKTSTLIKKAEEEKAGPQVPEELKKYVEELNDNGKFVVKSFTTFKGSLTRDEIKSLIEMITSVGATEVFIRPKKDFQLWPWNATASNLLKGLNGNADSDLETFIAQAWDKLEESAQVYVFFTKEGGPKFEKHQELTSMKKMGHMMLKPFPIGGMAAPMGGKFGAGAAVPVSAATAETAININYLDARENPTQEPPLAVKMVAEAFAKGQLIHKNKDLYNPESALILADEKRVIIGMRLGVHSARIQFALMPVQEGGRVAVNYTDSGGGYSPGSDIRIKALAIAFEAVGFKVHHEGYHMDAYFDKDSGASSIDELKEKIEFAIQALTSTKDLDLAINNSDLKANPSKGAEMLAGYFRQDGYLIRTTNEAYSKLQDKLLEPTAQSIWSEMARLAKFLGIQSFTSGQRGWDQISERQSLLLARGALIMGTDGSLQINSAYEKARKQSPLDSFFGLIASADASSNDTLRRFAAIAKALSPFSIKQVVGSVGRYRIERHVLPLVNDQLVFYVLRDAEKGTYHLAYQALGEFQHDGKIYVPALGKVYVGNSLWDWEVGNILTEQNMTTSTEYQEWIRANEAKFGGYTSVEAFSKSIFRLIKPGGEEALNEYIPPFEIETLLGKSARREVLSPVSFIGVRTSDGKTLGRVAIKSPDKKAADYKNKILIARYTEPEDDDSIKNSNGVIVTTGGVLSHAAIRSREHKKPALILNGAKFAEDGMRFKRFKGEEVRKEFDLAGTPISYYELSDYTEEEVTVKDGDLVYVDAVKGVFYVIAHTEEEAAIQAFEKYHGWANESGFGAEVSDKRIGELSDLLKGIENISLLKAIIDDLLHKNLIPALELEKILSEVAKDTGKKVAIVEYLRSQVLETFELFEKALAEYRQTIKTTDDAEQVFLMVDNLINQAKQLEQMIQLANGDWTGPISAGDVKKSMEEIIKLGRDWLKAYQQTLIKRLAAFKADDSNGLMRLLRLSGALGLSGLSLPILRPDLDELIKVLEEKRHEEVSEKIGRGVVWKQDLKDRFARPIAGGKGAHSGETVYVLETLKKAGVISEAVLNPEGFVIQPEEYRLWAETGKPGDLDNELKRAIAVNYRDLTVRQMQSLLEFIESDGRTSERWKKSAHGYLNLGIKSLKLVTNENFEMVDAFVLQIRKLLLSTIDTAEQYNAVAIKPEPISQSLIKRAQVLGAVAVRSSGLKEDSHEEAMAGLRKSPLNVFGGLDEIYKAILEVWKSGAEGVLIEEMINAKISGIAFSADPVEKRTDHIRITAAYGLAKGLVDHQVTNPDSYVVGKTKVGGEKYKTISSDIRGKEEEVVLDLEKGGTKLNTRAPDFTPALDSDAQELVASVVDAISKYFGFQVDMEWSIDSTGRLVVLQVRPITMIAESIQSGRKYLVEENPAVAGFGVQSVNSESIQTELGSLVARQALRRDVGVVLPLSSRYPSVLRDVLLNSFGNEMAALRTIEGKKRDILSEIESWDLNTLVITDRKYIDTLKQLLADEEAGPLLKAKLAEVNQIVGLFKQIDAGDVQILAETLRKELGISRRSGIYITDHTRPITVDLKSTAISLLGEIPDNLRAALGADAERISSEGTAFAALLDRFAELQKISTLISQAA